MKFKFQNRMLANLRIGAAAGAMALAGAACSTEQEPEPGAGQNPGPGKNDTVRIELRSSGDVREILNAAGADGGKYYIADVKRDLDADSADLAGAYGEWARIAASKGNVEERRNGHGIYPRTASGRVITHADWERAGKWPVSPNPSDGNAYLAATAADSAGFQRDGIRMDVFRATAAHDMPREGDVVLHVSRREDFAAAVRDAYAHAQSGTERVFVSIDASFSLADAEMAAAADNPRNAEIHFTGNGRLDPRHDDMPADGAVLKMLLPVLAQNSSNRFFVAGTDGAAMLAGAPHYIHTDTISLSRWENGETNLIAKMVVIDRYEADMRLLYRAAANFKKGYAAYLKIRTDMRGPPSPVFVNMNTENTSIIIDRETANIYEKFYFDPLMDHDNPDKCIPPEAEKKIINMGYKFIFITELKELYDNIKTDEKKFNYLMPGSVDLSDGVLRDLDIGKGQKSGLVHILEIRYSGYVDGKHHVPAVTGLPDDGVMRIKFSTAPSLIDTWNGNTGYTFVSKESLFRLSDVLCEMGVSKIQYPGGLFVLAYWGDKNRSAFEKGMADRKSIIGGEIRYSDMYAIFMGSWREQYGSAVR